jgi:outer membrane protein TolC
MKRFRCGLGAIVISALLAPVANAQETRAAQPINLSAALRLAGAENLDVKIAVERLNEARATHEQARFRFFPWLSPGIGYRRHDGNIQDVSGNVFDVSKQSYVLGVTLNAQLDLGEAIYQSLAARQLAHAALEASEAQRQEAVFAAAVAYFELLRAMSSVGVAEEAVRLAGEIASQTRQAADAGIAFRGDAYRAEVQQLKNAAQVRQSEEQRRNAAARLAEIVQLDPATDLLPQESELVPLTLVATNIYLGELIARALAQRPEVRQYAALGEAATAAVKGATTGPWIPTLGAQVAAGGLGGGRNDDWGNFDDTQDYFVGLSWRLGPGGLFDRSRTRAAEARRQTALLGSEKVTDLITRQIVEAHNRVASSQDQLLIAERTVSAAEELLRLSRERREFGVGIVLETIQAEQELTRARLDYLRMISEHNQAQFALRRFLGTEVTPR